MKKFLGALCTMCMVLSLSVPAFAADGFHSHSDHNASGQITPRGIVHCQVGSRVGHLIEENITVTVGKTTQTCPDVVGATDTKYQYQDIEIQSCTLCDYYLRRVVRTYWGNWEHTH